METPICHEPPKPTRNDFVDFTSIGAEKPENIFVRSYAKLIAMRVRRDIAQRIATYSAFQGKVFDAKIPKLSDFKEEIGLEPEIQGWRAA